MRCRASGVARLDASLALQRLQSLPFFFLERVFAGSIQDAKAGAFAYARGKAGRFAYVRSLASTVRLLGSLTSFIFGFLFRLSRREIHRLAGKKEIFGGRCFLLDAHNI